MRTNKNKLSVSGRGNFSHEKRSTKGLSPPAALPAATLTKGLPAALLAATLTATKMRFTPDSDRESKTVTLLTVPAPSGGSDRAFDRAEGCAIPETERRGYLC